MSALDLVDILDAIRRRDPDTARTAARRAAAHDRGGLAEALRDWFERDRPMDVYTEPSGFEAFIENGTNPALYAATIDHLRTVHQRTRPTRVLDIGCGDGRVTQAVVGEDTHRIDLVEPSPALLDTALARLATTNATINPHPIGILEHLEHGDASVTWDLAQSTFALHTLHPADRSDTLSRLAARTSHLVIVEFDVPFFDDADDSASFLQSLADRYDVGIREYPEHPEAVQQFLIPVLLGLLDTDRPRHTYEQPVSQWHADLSTAGFRRVITENLFDYWWGTATAITATGTPTRVGLR